MSVQRVALARLSALRVQSRKVTFTQSIPIFAWIAALVKALALPVPSLQSKKRHSIISEGPFRGSSFWIMLEDFRLRVFVTVARCGSFTLAARELGVSQPAVSQSIASLEQAVGAPLFVRSRGRLSLTQKGSLMLEYAGRILYWYGRIDAELVRGTDAPPRKLPLTLGENSQALVSVEDGVICIDVKKFSKD